MSIPDGDARSFLLALIGDSVVNMKKAQKLMDNTEDTKRKTVRITAVQYRVASVEYTCTHCHAIYSVEKTLNTKTESFSYVGHDKQVYIVNWKTLEQPITIRAITNTCDSCESFIKQLSREALEQRYINSIKRIPLESKPTIKKPISPVDYSDLDLDSEYNIIQEGEDTHGRELERIERIESFDEIADDTECQVYRSGLQNRSGIRTDSNGNAGSDEQDGCWEGKAAACSTFQSAY
jgi:hypothetical protein